MRLELQIVGKSVDNLIEGLEILIDKLESNPESNGYIPLNDIDRTEIDYDITQAETLDEDCIVMVSEKELK